MKKKNTNEIQYNTETVLSGNISHWRNCLNNLMFQIKTFLRPQPENPSTKSFLRPYCIYSKIQVRPFRPLWYPVSSSVLSTKGTRLFATLVLCIACMTCIKVTNFDMLPWLYKASWNIHTVMSLLEAPCTKTSWKALLFHAIFGITGALIVCFDIWRFKQAKNSETGFDGHHCDFEQRMPCFISYLGMKSWDLYVCDRASTITHVDRVKKSNPWYNKIWLCLNVTIWSSQICLLFSFILL